MPRELRPRKTRQRYTEFSLDEREDEQEPGPSQPRSMVPEDRGDKVDDGDIGSDFAPPGPEEIALSEQDDNDTQDARRASGSGSSEGDQGTQRSGKKKKKRVAAGPPSKTPAKTKAKGKSKAPTLVPAAAARQNHTLPNPNVHHRHRPVPLFRPTRLRVERLLRAPRLFAPNEFVPTHAYASSPALTRRVGKAWGASVGAGPAWPIVEDFGWFRESGDVEEEGEEEAGGTKVLLYAESVRRPRVYVGIEVPRGGTEAVGVRAPLLLRAECVSPAHFVWRREF
jgi:transcription factor C subunit 6